MPNGLETYMNIGHTKTDTEHLMLFVLLAQLATTSDRDSALECLKNLHSCFIVHCASEEILMRHMKNPTRNEHTISHIDYKDKITSSIKQIDNYTTNNYSAISNILDQELSIHINDWDAAVFTKGTVYEDLESGFGL